MPLTDRDLAIARYHRIRAEQEHTAALEATDRRSRDAHLGLAIVHEVYAFLGHRDAPAA